MQPGTKKKIRYTAFVLITGILMWAAYEKGRGDGRLQGAEEAFSFALKQLRTWK